MGTTNGAQIIGRPKPPEMIPVPTSCECCGEEVPEIAQEVRMVKLATGMEPRIPVAKLRPPVWCSKCITAANSLVRQVRTMEETNHDG